MGVSARRMVKRAAFGPSRLVSKAFRARTDLFDADYEPLAGWKSGLGQGAILLYAMARNLKPAVIVEIGSARGKSSCSLALACRDNGKGKVYAIDPHLPNPWSEIGTSGDNEAFLRSRLASYGLDGHCEVIRAASSEAARSWKLPIDLIFIDGSHSYDGVRSDFELFEPWFADGCLVVFHDTTWGYEEWEQVRRDERMAEDLGVPRYLEELRRAGRPSVTFSPAPGITILDPKSGGRSFLEGKGWPA